MPDSYDEARLAALRRLALLDTEPEAGFDSITDLAVALTGASMAAVSLVDRSRQWFKSRIGLDVCETGRDIAFCDHAIRQSEILYVPDALKDERFHDNPLVTGAPHIRGYAGAQLYSHDGFALGTLCVIHDAPLALDAATLERLVALARIVEQQIQIRGRADRNDRVNRMLAAIAKQQAMPTSDAPSLRATFEHLLATALEFTDSKYGFIGEIFEDAGSRYLKTHAITDLSWNHETRAFYAAQVEQGLELRNPGTPFEHTIQTGEPVLLAAPLTDPGAGGLLPGHPVLTSYMGVPLFSRGEFIAMLGLANREGGYDQELMATCEPLLITMGNLVQARRMEQSRDRAMAELAITTSRLDLAIEGSSVGVWELDPMTGETFVSDRLLQIIGRSGLATDRGGVSREDGLKNFRGRVHRDDLPAVEARLKAHLERREPFEVEFRFAHSQGHYIVLYGRGQALWDEAGQPIRMAGSVEDVTAQRELVLEQQRTKQRLETITELGGIGSWEVRLQTGEVLWDQITREIHEVDADFQPDLATGVDFYAPEVRDHVNAVVARAIERGASWDFELPLITAKQNRIWVRAVGRAEYEDGVVTKLVGSFQDISERKAREDELAALSSRLELALDASGIGVWEHILSTGELWCDEETRRLFGVPDAVESVSIEGWKAQVHHEDRDEAAARIDTALRTGSRYTSAYRIVRPGGEIRHIRSHGVFRTRLQGDTVISGVNIDVTSEVERAEELDRQRAVAETANRAKSRFIANMSHEIRTPLNGVLGISQLLQTTTLTPVQRGYVDTLTNSGVALLELVEDILDISKIESGTVEIAREPFRLRPVVESVLDILQNGARQKDIILACADIEAIPMRVIGDEKRVRQLLINMIGNAVKFTEQGRIDLTVEVVPDGCIRFSITDTGPGIPADQLERVFGRFAQVDDSQTRRHGGSGLGLAICRELVELAGGRIGVRSEFGHGSTFWFEWPLPRDTAPEDEVLSAAPSLPAPVAAKGARVLVVDDVATNQLVATALVENAGHVVRVAANGQQAIEALDSGEFDAVLMDIQMPVMSGDEAIRKIRASGKAYSEVPIFALTADATKGVSERLIGLGATGYLSKPLSMIAVADALNRVLPAARP